MNVCFHVAHAAMKPVNTGLAYRSRDLALAVLEYLTKLASRLRSKPAAVPKLGDKVQKVPCEASEAKFSRIGPEQNRLCRIADIGRGDEGRVLFGEQPARCAVRSCYRSTE